MVGDGVLVAHAIQHANHDQFGAAGPAVDDVGAIKRRPEPRREAIAGRTGIGKRKHAVEAALQRGKKTSRRRLGCLDGDVNPDIGKVGLGRLRYLEGERLANSFLP